MHEKSMKVKENPMLPKFSELISVTKKLGFKIWSFNSLRRYFLLAPVRPKTIRFSELQKARVEHLSSLRTSFEQIGHHKLTVLLLITIRDEDNELRELISSLELPLKMINIVPGFYIATEDEHTKSRIESLLGELMIDEYIIKVGSSKDSDSLAWNELIRSAPSHTKYVTTLEITEPKEPWFIHRAVKILEKYKNYDVYTSGAKVKTKALFAGNSKESHYKYIEPNRFIFEHLLKNPILGQANMFWRIGLHEMHGVFNEKYRLLGAMEFWLRVARAGHFSYEDPVPSVVLPKREKLFGDSELRREWLRLNYEFINNEPYRV